MHKTTAEEEIENMHNRRQNYFNTLYASLPQNTRYLNKNSNIERLEKQSEQDYISKIMNYI